MEIREWNHSVSNPMSATCRRFVDVPAVTRREMPKLNKVLGDNLTQSEVIFDSLSTCRSPLASRKSGAGTLTGYEHHQERNVLLLLQNDTCTCNIMAATSLTIDC